jgi:hypothetical protein
MFPPSTQSVGGVIPAGFVSLRTKISVGFRDNTEAEKVTTGVVPADPVSVSLDCNKAEAPNLLMFETL